MKSYKFIKLLLPLLFILPSCKENKMRIPLYHIEGINFKVDKKYYHLLYSMDKDALSILIDKQASFFLSIYSESCSDSCSMFDASLYAYANSNDAFIPYMNKSIYDTIKSSSLPSIKENAILFFEEGKLLKQVDITENNVSIEKVKETIDTYTYDTKLKIVTPFIKDTSDNLINCFKFSSYDLSNKSIIFPEISSSDKTLFLDIKRTLSIKDIQSSYTDTSKINDIYLYEGINSLTSDFYTSLNIKKEELEKNSSYIR